MKFLVINGPNLNLLGLREPAIYGSQNYEALLSLVRAACDAEGIGVDFFQSNSCAANFTSSAELNGSLLQIKSANFASIAPNLISPIIGTSEWFTSCSLCNEFTTSKPSCQEVQ